VKRSEEEWRGVKKSAQESLAALLSNLHASKVPTARDDQELETRELFDYCNLAICFSASPPHLASPASPGRSERSPITEPQLSMNGGVQQLACVEKIPPSLLPDLPPCPRSLVPLLHF
jgi:hypothetical protein